jgi:hypothetical protein
MDTMKVIDHTKQGLELRVESVREATGTVRNELLEKVQCIEKEAAATKQGLQMHITQLQSDTVTLRDLLNSEIQATNKRIVQEGERLDDQMKHVGEEFQSALRTDHDYNRAERTRMRSELQELLSQLDHRIQRVHDTSMARLAELGSHISTVQAESAAQQDETNKALQALNNIVDRTQDQAADAKRRAATSELAMREQMKGLQESEIRCLTEGHVKLKDAARSLTAGVLRIAQCVGLLPSHDARGEAIGDASTPLGPRWDKVDLQDLLAWEQAGNPLADRIGKAWQPMISNNCTTIVDMVQRKAEGATVKLLQMAIRDLDVRVSGVVGERDAWRDLGLATNANSNKGRAIAAAQTFGTNFGPASRIALGLEDTNRSLRSNAASGIAETIVGWGQPETPTAAPSMMTTMMSPTGSAAISSAAPTPSGQGFVVPRGDPLTLHRIAAYGDGMSGRTFRAGLDSESEDKVDELQRPLGPKPEGDPRYRQRVF